MKKTKDINFKASRLESIAPEVCFVYDDTGCFTQPYVFENGKWVPVDSVTITVTNKKHKKKLKSKSNRKTKTDKKLEYCDLTHGDGYTCTCGGTVCKKAKK